MPLRYNILKRGGGGEGGREEERKEEMEGLQRETGIKKEGRKKHTWPKLSDICWEPVTT